MLPRTRLRRSSRPRRLRGGVGVRGRCHLRNVSPCALPEEAESKKGFRSNYVSRAALSPSFFPGGVEQPFITRQISRVARAVCDLSSRPFPRIHRRRCSGAWRQLVAEESARVPTVSPSAKRFQRSHRMLRPVCRYRLAGGSLVVVFSEQAVSRFT